MSQPAARVLLRLVLLVLLLLTMSHPALAQVTAAISGRVQDSSGAGVPDAMVTATSAETGAARTATTDTQGEYRIVSLAVGRYELKVEKTGFKVAVQAGIDLVVGQDAVINLSLEVGQVQQQVTVTGEAPLVNTTTASVSGLVDEKEVKELPLNGRSFDNLISLNAGAVPVTSLKNAGANAQSGNLFSVSGRRYYENLFILNGVEYMGPSQQHSVPGGVSGQLLGIDAVREFNVQTDAYGAEYGKRAGGQVSIVTQSGTNQLHGTAFEFLRNSALDAANFFDHPVNSVTGAPERIPPFKRNQFGGALGGPIQKDKTFIFGNYEGFRQRLGLSSISFVPDANARKGFLPCNVINPTGAGCAGNSKSDITPTPVPKLVAGILPYLNAYWPVGNGPNLGQGVAEAIYNPLQSIREDFGIVRVDHNFSAKDTIGTSYLVDDGINLNPQANPLWHQDQYLRSQVLSVQETHIFTPNVVNTLTVGYSRAAYQYDNPPAPGYTPAVSPLVPGQLWGRLSIGGINTTTGGTITAAGATIIADAVTNRNAFTYGDSIQVIKGRHQISAGVWFERLQSNELEPQNQAGSASFSTLTSFLQGTLLSFAVAPVTSKVYWRQLEGAWYVQDSIQVRRNLTVRLGLRHEFTNGWNEAHGNASNYYLINGVYLTNPVLGSSIYSNNNARLLFGPRVGLAWDIFGNGKTSLRAAFGTHYSMEDDLANSLDHNPPFNGVLTYASGTPFFSIIPVNPAAPLPVTCGPGVTGTCAQYAPGGVLQNAKVPTIEEWNLAVEQAISANMSLRVAYVGSHGFHLTNQYNPNQIDPQICSNAAGCTSGGYPAFNAPTNAALRTTVPQGTEYIPVENVPNPYVSAGASLVSNGLSSFNALETEFTRRFNSGLQFRANYTWSKELDEEDGYSGDPGGGSPQDYWNPRQSGWGASGDNQKHKFIFAGGYELPIGKDKPFLNNVNGAADKLLSGWQLNSIVTVLSGFPFSATTGSNRSGAVNSGTGSDRPSYAPGFSASDVVSPNIFSPVGVLWFNPNAFVPNTIGTFGNVGKNAFTGPDLREVDLSLFKTTSIREKINAQFRVEVFNILNRPNFSNPTTGSQSIFSGTAISPSAGLISTTATTSRQIQFGLKLNF